MSITLPKPNEKISIKAVNPRILLLYGSPKVGKTEIASQLENSLLIDCEDGSDFIEATKIKANNLVELNKIGGEIIKQGKPFDYIIVDTLTEMEVWCEEAATEAYKNSVIGKSFKGDSVLELPKGSGYHWLRMEYFKYFKALQTLPTKCLIGIAHVKDKFLVDKKGREVESSDLDLTGKLKSITCSRADAIGYIYRKDSVEIIDGKVKQDLWVSFNSNEVVTGTRSKHLINADFKFDWKKIFIEETI